MTNEELKASIVQVLNYAGTRELRMIYQFVLHLVTFRKGAGA